MFLKPVTAIFITVILMISLTACKEKANLTQNSAGTEKAGSSAVAKQSGEIKTLAGSWMIFLHYKDGTEKYKVVFDQYGNAVSSESSVLDNLRLRIFESGVLMVNRNIKISGRYGYDRIDGMAVVGSAEVVPCSAIKLSFEEGNK